MKTLIISIICFLLLSSGEAQPSDILILKKRSHPLQTFFPGSEIAFNTSNGYYNGFIQSIQRDSLFLLQYDIRQIPTTLGIYILDTVATYHFAVNYKQITGFGKTGYKKFDWSASGGALAGGGVLITVVGLGTWLFTKPNTRYYASPYLVGGAALLAGIGYLLARSNGKGMEIGKKYSLQYLHVN